MSTGCFRYRVYKQHLVTWNEKNCVCSFDFIIFLCELMELFGEGSCPQLPMVVTLDEVVIFHFHSRFGIKDGICKVRRRRVLVEF